MSTIQLTIAAKADGRWHYRICKDGEHVEGGIVSHALEATETARFIAMNGRSPEKAEVALRVHPQLPVLVAVDALIELKLEELRAALLEAVESQPSHVDLGIVREIAQLGLHFTYRDAGIFVCSLCHSKHESAPPMQSHQAAIAGGAQSSPASEHHGRLVGEALTNLFSVGADITAEGIHLDLLGETSAALSEGDAMDLIAAIGRALGLKSPESFYLGATSACPADPSTSAGSIEPLPVSVCETPTPRSETESTNLPLPHQESVCPASPDTAETADLDQPAPPDLAALLADAAIAMKTLADCPSVAFRLASAKWLEQLGRQAAELIRKESH